ncbi:MAG: transporter [Deltaproteobacteria bacterium]|nr:transporter [Deltaproteobacteria bacterium]
MKKETVAGFLGLIVCFLLAPGGSARGAEKGIGHYSPGMFASFIDAAPTGLVVENVFNTYSGSAGAERIFPIGILLAADVDFTSYADVFVIAYGTPWGILGGKFSFAATIPYVWADVTAQLSGPTRSFTRRDRAEGLGDMMLVPFWLAWNKGEFKWDVRLGIYAPTGAYDKEDLANVGLNYWTFEPTVSFSYLNTKIGLEVTAFAGMDFNTKNTDIDYRSGDVVHFDLTVAEHLPLFDCGILGVGVNAFYWKQLTGDSGSGARLGSFEGRTAGIGPVLSYISPPICGQTILVEAKWLPELDTSNRLEGDTIWIKLVWAF